MQEQIPLPQFRTVTDFPFNSFDKLRYADTDRQGHVNNAAFATFLETGRVEFLYDSNNPLADNGASFVIAGLNLHLKAEIHWPGKVDIGTAVARVGNSSLHLFQGVFQGNRCAATAETVIVQMHDQSRKSHPLTDHAKAFLNRHRVVV